MWIEYNLLPSVEKKESGIQNLDTRDFLDHQSQQTLVAKWMTGSGRMTVDNIFRILSNVGIMPKTSFLEKKPQAFLKRNNIAERQVELKA